jgi:hypothetical protein
VYRTETTLPLNQLGVENRNDVTTEPR